MINAFAYECRVLPCAHDSYLPAVMCSNTYTEAGNEITESTGKNGFFTQKGDNKSNV